MLEMEWPFNFHSFNCLLDIGRYGISKDFDFKMVVFKKPLLLCSLNSRTWTKFRIFWANFYFLIRTKDFCYF